MIPEQRLWNAMILNALIDACPIYQNETNPTNAYRNRLRYDDYVSARRWFEGGSGLTIVCHLAGRDPEYVSEKALDLFNKFDAMSEAEQVRFRENIEEQLRWTN